MLSVITSVSEVIHWITVITIHSSHAELVSANFCTAFMPDSENIEPIGR